MYLNFYGLKENPFNVTSDPDFLYLSKPHKHALDHLAYGISAKKGFIAITGEIGSGKTTLCRALLKQLDTKTKTSVIFNPKVSDNQLLEAIISDFGLTPARKTKGAMIKQLNDFLLEQLRSGNNAVLIIDESQNLSVSSMETVRMLSNLETHKEKLIQIVLFGQPQLRDKLNSPELLQLKQRISVRFHLKALEKDETQGYIEHRISTAGSSDAVKFPADSVDAVFEFSGGIPRVINLICDKALLLGYINETKVIDRSFIERCARELEG